MKKIIFLKLKVLSKLILAKYKPKIIGITGSVGKTSARDAVYGVLKGKKNVRSSIKNYNNEIGLPLTVIGASSPGKSIIGWIGVFIKALKLILFKDSNYPEILILEMGIDRPGDMDYLTDIVSPDIGILTFIGTVHAEYFNSRVELRKEKAKLIKAVAKKGWSIINYDNEECRKVIRESKAKVITYGFDEQADLRAQQITYNFDGNKDSKKPELKGIIFKLAHKGSFAPVLLPDVLGLSAVYAALAGAAAGIVNGMNLVEISEALKTYASPKGRMKVIEGIKHTIIIDDTYNAEPASTSAALGVLKQIPISEEARKFAVLGNMLELGQYSEDGHRDIGKYVHKCGINYLVAVGELARDIARGARNAGMAEDHIFEFPHPEVAGRFIQDRIKEGDILLVKGSQGARMEKIVKELMAEPLRAEELLVRQEREWIG